MVANEAFLERVYCCCECCNVLTKRYAHLDEDVEQWAQLKESHRSRPRMQISLLLGVTPDRGHQ